MLIAMMCAGAVTAQLVSGKATRDALFLASLDFTALPTMLIATSVFSLVLVAANSRGSRLVKPAILVPVSFLASGVLFLLEWLLTYRAPSAAAISVYLHISGAGPLLASGFWLIATERFDPRTAKRRFGQIAAAGTLGGLVSALVAERVAAFYGVGAMLPILATLHFASAWLVRRLALDLNSRRPEAVPAPAPGSPGAAPSRSGLRVVLEAPYLRHLAALVLLGTSSAALVDYLFKAQAASMFGRGDELLRFFALYYAGTSLLTFGVQALGSGAMLQRFGLALTTSTPSLALLAGSIGSLIAPGFGSLLIARGGEAVFRGSFFRAGYELFYTPIPAAEKRAAKSLIDVGFDRLGDAVGGGLVRLVLFLAPMAQSSVILGLGVAGSIGALLAASRLNRGYIQTLQNSLLDRAGAVDLGQASDRTTRTLILDVLGRGDSAWQGSAAAPDPARAARHLAVDAEVQDILRLRSRNRAQVAEVLRRPEGLTPNLVPHAIPLLAWDAVAEDAVFALRKVAEERVGQLVDALIDPSQDFDVRRRLARVFSIGVSQRAADGLLLGLEDPRFDVRYQSGRSLVAIVERNPRIRIDQTRIFDAVLREVAVGRPVWESRRLIDEYHPAEHSSVVDDFVRARAGESLAHVFALLSLVLPREPLRMAFRGLQTDDRQLKGTALEYLESVLPSPIRQRLWPFLEQRPLARPARPHDEVIADLLRSQHSIMINLEELKRRAPGASPLGGRRTDTAMAVARRA